MNFSTGAVVRKQFYLNVRKAAYTSKGPPRGNADLIPVKRERRDASGKVTSATYWKGPAELHGVDQIQPKGAADPHPTFEGGTAQQATQRTDAVIANPQLDHVLPATDVHPTKVTPELHRKRTIAAVLAGFTQAGIGIKRKMYAAASKVIQPLTDQLHTTARKSDEQAHRMIGYYLHAFNGLCGNFSDAQIHDFAVKHLAPFLEHFTKAMPTHTTSLGHVLASKNLDERHLATVHASALHASVDKEESARFYAHLRHSLETGGYETLHDHIFKPLIAGIDKVINEQLHKGKTTKDLECAIDDRNAFKKLTDDLHLWSDPEWRKSYPEEYEAQIQEATKLISSMRKTVPSHSGLNNSFDKAAGVDGKICVALHNTSRYEKDQGVTFVLPRHELAQEGATMTATNAATVAGPHPWHRDATGAIDNQEGIYSELGKGGDKDPFGTGREAAAKMKKGELVFKDIDNPLNVLAFALHHAMRRMLGGKGGAPGTLDEYNAPVTGEGRQLKNRPDSLAEGHLASNQNLLESSEKIVAANKETADVLREHFPHYAHKIVVPAPGQSVYDTVQAHENQKFQHSLSSTTPEAASTYEKVHTMLSEMHDSKEFAGTAAGKLLEHLSRVF